MGKLKCVYEILPPDGRECFSVGEDVTAAYEDAAKKLKDIDTLVIDEKMSEIDGNDLYIGFAVTIDEAAYDAAQQKFWDGGYRTGLGIVKD